MKSQPVVHCTVHDHRLSQILSLSFAVAWVDRWFAPRVPFHVSMLRKYLKDPKQKMDAGPLTIQLDLTMECHPVRILNFLIVSWGTEPSSMWRFYGLISQSGNPHGNWRRRCVRNIPSSSSLVSNWLFICASFSQSCVSDTEFRDEFL